MIGVYKITCKENGCVYVGQSVNIIKRFCNHRYALKNNTHSNKYLQDDFNKYGIDSFLFEVVTEVSYSKLNEVEQYYIDYYGKTGNTYNIIQRVCRNKHNKHNKYEKGDDEPLLTGEQIKQIREALGLTRKQLSEILSIKMDTILNCEEHGIRKHNEMISNYLLKELPKAIANVEATQQALQNIKIKFDEGENE